MRARPIATAGGLLVVAAILFGMMVETGLLKAFDHAAFAWGEAGRSTAAPWVLITRFGDGGSRILICLAAMLLLWRRRDIRAMLLLPSAALAETLTSSGLKLLFARQRPAMVPHLDAVTSLSYPSGHASHNLALWMMIALLLAPGRRWAIPGAIMIALMIGLSRIVLGVHWPTDVLGGLMLGGGAALLARTVYDCPCLGQSIRSS